MGILGDDGSEKARLAEGGRNRPSNQETLETRVNRIEDKPLVYFQFGNRREECFD